jgi:hypothetical protein
VIKDENLIRLHYLQQVTEETLSELKACFLEAYDDNKDGKIDIREVGSKSSKLKHKLTKAFSLLSCSQWRKTFCCSLGLTILLSPVWSS